MSIKLNLTAKPEGYFKLIRRGPDLKIREETPWFHNLIVDSGLDHYGISETNKGIILFAVGTGTTAPNVAQTGLTSMVGSWRYYGSNPGYTETAGAAAVPPYHGWYRRSIRFNPGQATGNLSEVGVAWGTITSNFRALFARELIRDIDNNPTSITVLADEYLDVYYELRNYPDVVDKNFVINLMGVNYDVLMRPCRVTSGSWGGSIMVPFQRIAPGDAGFSARGTRVFDGSLGLITGSPAGNSLGDTENTGAQTYVVGSYQRTNRWIYGLTYYNLAGGIKSITFATNLGLYQAEFTPAIPKTAARLLTMDLTVSWDRTTIP